MTVNQDYDVVIIGGGFFGCQIAIYLKNYFNRIVILEKENTLLTKASTNNQARVHNGYHYPRSILTAWRSHINFPRFIQDYQSCILSDFNNYYAVGKKFSKVNAKQFKLFCERISIPLTTAESSIIKLFNPDLIEAVFKTQEYVFDINELTKLVTQQLIEKNITIYYNSQAKTVKKTNNNQLLTIYRQEGKLTKTITSNYVFNCTYSGLNTILDNSQLPTIPLKHELTEMALVKVPTPLKNVGITVVCGPFFSLMPFPSQDLYTLSHVRYTPHCYWQDHHNYTYPTAEIYQLTNPSTNYYYMVQDAKRYLPILADCIYTDSLWEVKTVLPQSEINDSRPILFQENSQLPRLISVLGGKIDNIYDVFAELKNYFSFP